MIKFAYTKLVLLEQTKVHMFLLRENETESKHKTQVKQDI